MNENVRWKMVAIVFALVATLTGASWAIDGRMDDKIHRQLEPLRQDVQAIRQLLENFLIKER